MRQLAAPFGGLDRIDPLPAQKQQKTRTPKANDNSMLLLVLGRKPRTPFGNHNGCAPPKIVGQNDFNGLPQMERDKLVAEWKALIRRDKVAQVAPPTGGKTSLRKLRTLTLDMKNAARVKPPANLGYQGRMLNAP